VRLRPLGTSATVWPTVLAADGGRWWVWRNWWNDWQGKPKCSQETCSCRFVHHKSHMTWSGLEPGPPRWKASNWPPEVKVKVTLWPAVSRPVRLGVRRPSGTHDQFFFLLEILFRQLQVCYFVVLSLAKVRVCNLLLLLVLASAVPLGSALSDERSRLSFDSISL
jgi:hypothetical protein